jgi:saccharopine dehydrogenase-like NADP-dependent oxidoreductase
MGRYAVRTAMTYDFVDEIIVADLDGRRAAAFAEEGGAKLTPCELNVEDPDALERVLQGAGVVLNTVGPFYRFGVPILHAAIRARCHYLDINDDWEPTLEMMELDPEARRAGVTAIVGMGASPGVSNLLAVKAMNRLDSVEEVITGWGLDGADPSAERSARPQGSGARATRPPSAALVHWMHQCSGRIRILRDGRLVDVPPIEEVKVDYPGIGSATAWTVGHPEAVTLARFRPEIRSSVNVMVGRRWLIEIVRSIANEIDAGRISAEQGAALLSTPIPTGPPDRPTSERKEPRLPPLFAVARGIRDGNPATVGATVRGMPSGGMAGATGVPLAVGLSLLAGGRIDRSGVFPPEAAIEPDAFFDALATRCSPPFEQGVGMVVLATSS